MKTLQEVINLLRSLTIGEAAAIATGATVALMVLLPAIGTIGVAVMLAVGLTHLTSSDESNAI